MGLSGIRGLNDDAAQCGTQRIRVPAECDDRELAESHARSLSRLPRISDPDFCPIRKGGQPPIDQQSPPRFLDPEMATFYREQLNARHDALRDDTEATRPKSRRDPALPCEGNHPDAGRR